MDDMKVWIAQRYELCCQRSPDSWDSCLDDFGDDYDELYRMLIAANIACRNDNRQLMRQIVDEFYRRLFPDSSGFGYGLVDGVLQGGRETRNVFPVLDIDGEVRVSAVSAPATVLVRDIGTLSVHGTCYLPAAAGPASAIIKARNGFDPLVTVNGSGPGLPETSYSFAGGLVGVRARGVTQQHSIQKGTLRIVGLVSGPETRYVPSEFKWELDRNGEATTITLDRACPFNEVVFDDVDSGTLQMGVVIDSELEAAVRIESMGTVWISLPFVVNPDGSLLVGTDGWAGSTEVFPLSGISEAALANPPLNDPPPLPDNREEACDDVNQDGIRDGANALINLFELSECD